MKPHQQIHPSFRLNGLSHTNQELVSFLGSLKQEGAAYEIEIADFIIDWLSEDTKIITYTSGSTGTPKAISLEKSKMIASARATGEALQLPEHTEALLCLSANYIAGKMMLVRAMVLGWHLHAVEPSRNFLVEYDNQYDFAAMVPYQALHSLEALDKVGKLLIGGGVVPPKLAQGLQNSTCKAYASYGMTETITHVALRAINGPEKSEAFTALPGVNFSVDARGCLVVNAPYIFLDPIITNDVVERLNQRQFIWKGRIDNVINSGGVKIHPEHVEAQLAEHIQVPFFIASMPDEQLGQKMILIMECPAKDRQGSGLTKSSFEHLAPYQRPKKVYSVSSFPYTDTGKVKRQEVLELISKYNN